MLKKYMQRFVSSMAYGTMFSSVICTISSYISSLANPGVPVAVFPNFAELFPLTETAAMAQIVMAGLVSGAFGGGTVIFDNPMWGNLKQGILYFLATAVIWIPVALLCWGVTEHPEARVIVIISMIITYIVMWIIRYFICKKNIEEINLTLEKMRNKKSA